MRGLGISGGSARTNSPVHIDSVGETTYLGGDFDAFFFILCVYWAFLGGIWDSGGFLPEDTWKLILPRSDALLINREIIII